MHRSDFQVIAEAIADLPDGALTPWGGGQRRWAQETLAEHFADKLEATNERFNRNQFVRAATGLDSFAVKITGLTPLNVAAIKETIADVLVTTTATTATFHTDRDSAIDIVSSVIAQLPPGEHPRHSLFAVRRKLIKA